MAFGRPERLGRALSDSGLAALGVATPAAYWSRIVAPTWAAASTSRRPFARFIADRLGPAAGRAADRFVADYLAASCIAAPWQPLLADLCRRPRVQVIVATDHYAEATDAIIGHLAAAGLKGCPLSAADTGAIRVANSADLGAVKADPRFWGRVAAAAGAGTMILVDDFGAAEAWDAGYGSEAAAARRARRTETAARTAGGWQVTILTYPPPPDDGDLAAAVSAIGTLIMKVLDAR